MAEPGNFLIGELMLHEALLPRVTSKTRKEPPIFPGCPGSSEYAVQHSRIYGAYSMVAHMKTTVEIADSLLASAKQLAAQKRTTLRALVEAGLRRVLEEHERGEPFRLRDASFTGRGLQPEFRDGDWEKIRDATYEGRGA